MQPTRSRQSVDTADAAPHPAIRLSDELEEQCRRLSATRTALTTLENTLLLGVLAALTLSGAAHHVLVATRTWLPAAWPAWVADLWFLLTLGFCTRCLLLPIHAVRDYWLERRYRLARESFGSWLWEWLCRSAIFGVATLLLLLPVAEWLPYWPWLILPGTVAFLLLRRLFLEWVYVPVVNLFYPVRFLRRESFVLPGHGTRTLPVYEVRVSHKTRRVSASLWVRGKQTAIFVTDTLIDAFTDGEERIVMAHEFGHLYDRIHLEERTRAGVSQAQRKLFWGTAQLAAGVAALLAMSIIAPRIGLAGVDDLAGFPLLAGLTLGLGNLFTPILCAEARRDERDADQYALAATGDPESYLSVMRKLREINLEEASGHRLGNVLWDTHPSYSDRAQLAFGYRERFTRRRRGHSFRGRRHIQRHGRR